MLVRSKQKQDCPLYNCLNGTTYNIQNISVLTANQGTNTLAFSYAELTLRSIYKYGPKAELTFLTVSLFSSHRQDLESHIHLAIWLGSLQNNFTY